MRIAIVSQGLGRIVPPKAHGSIATWSYQVARRLAHDHDVLAIEFGEKPFQSTRVVHEGVTYAYVATALNRIVNAAYDRLNPLWRALWTPETKLRRPAYTSIFHNLGFAVQAARLARRWRCDVIHLHNFSQLVPVMRLFNPSTTIVLHMNCEWLSQHDPKLIASRLEAADVVIGCSGHIARKVVSRFPALASKCTVVFNGADVEHFVPSIESVVVNPPEALRILFVGRISPEKGVHLLVDAFKTVAERFPTAHLDLVGGVGSLPAEFLVALSDDPLVKSLEAFYGTDYLAEIRKRIPEHLKDRVTFHGNQSHAELVSHYARATVFVNPSLSDAFPLTVVEAMAAGLPIVASRVGGVPESVADGVTGVLVEPNSAEALASGLCRVLADSGLRRRMAVAARDRALKLFSWQAIANSAVAAYRRQGQRETDDVRAAAS
jgi:glycosyltransferase involved in cell wall biosynthesis